MSEPTESAFKFRPGFVVWFLAGVGWLLIIAGSVLWWGLPRWTPDVVVEQSPWLGPAFEAAVHGSGMERTFQDRLPEWGDQVVPFMCAVATSSGDRGRRMLALRSMHPENDQRALPTLFALLHDPDEVIVHQALYQLVPYKDPVIVQPVLDLLKRSSFDVGLAAAEFLAKRPQFVSFDLISTTLLHSSRVEHQTLGCVVLRGGTDPRIIPALVERLGRLRHGRLDVAGYSLGQLSLPGTNEAIVAGLSDLDPRRRYGAVTAAGYLDSRTNRSAILQPLLRLLTDPEAEVRTAVVIALRNYADDAAVAALRSTIAAGGPLAVTAVESLRDNSSPVSLPTRLSFIDHPDTDVRKELIESMRYHCPIPDGFDNRLVLNLLRHQNPEVVEMAKVIALRLKLTPDEQRELDAARQ